MHVPPRSHGSARLKARRSPILRRVALPTQAFFHAEGVGGVLLLVASALALGLANSPFREAYRRTWELAVEVHLAGWGAHFTLHELINEGLMAVFFHVAGLEIKREMAFGQLSTVRRAALPVVAAMGGMVAPALLYLAINLGGAGSRGWGIPTATDIAFSVGVLGLLGGRVPASARTFLLALAIADDIGAILVIALFYSSGIAWGYLALAGLVLMALGVVNLLGIRSRFLQVAVAVAFWGAMLGSGIHATLAGVILGALTPIRSTYPSVVGAAKIRRLSIQLDRAIARGHVERAEAALGQIEVISQDTESPLDRRVRLLHPWSSGLVLPLFALANAGVELSGEALARSLGSAVTWGVALGLVVGKPLGIVAFARLADRIGWATLPESLDRRTLWGVGIVAGIGFTVSLFVAGLAFGDAGMVDDAKVGVMAGSALAGLAGFVVLSRRRPSAVDRPR